MLWSTSVELVQPLYLSYTYPREDFVVEMVMEQHMSAGCSKGFRKTNYYREKYFEERCHIIVIIRRMFSRNHYRIHTAGRRLIQDVNRQNADRRHLLERKEATLYKPNRRQFGSITEERRTRRD
jgi:hypothetical protein